jgi:hypothetical protein
MKVELGHLKQMIRDYKKQIPGLGAKKSVLMKFAEDSGLLEYHKSIAEKEMDEVPKKKSKKTE